MLETNPTEEYGPDICHIIKGEENCRVDALSHLPMTDIDQDQPCTDAKNSHFELFDSGKGETEPMFGFPLNLVKVALQNKPGMTTESTDFCLLLYGLDKS